MDEDDRDAGAGLFVKKLHAIVARQVGHSWSPQMSSPVAIEAVADVQAQAAIG
jgi:hypothetical protein